MADSGIRAVFCVGETMAQLAPVPPASLLAASTLTLDAAGAESTVAMCLARLGHAASWISRVGDDPLGERILRMLRAYDVDLRSATVDPAHSTGVYFKDPGDRGTRVLYYRSGSAASYLSAADIPWDRLGPSTLVHTSGITAALSPSAADLVDELLDRRSESGYRVSFDVNHRPALWRGRDAPHALHDLAARADLVFVGRDEAEDLWGTTTAEAVRELFRGTEELVVKDGEVGATAFAGAEAVFEPTEPVEVVEPVGAGDSFAAGYLHELLRSGDLGQRLRTGHRLAAAVLTTTADFVDPKGTTHVAEC